MSGSIELKINGQLIGHLYYHNKGFIGRDSRGRISNSYLYTWEYHTWPASPSPILKGELTHKRGEGVEKLVYLILKDILKQKAG